MKTNKNVTLFIESLGFLVEIKRFKGTKHGMSKWVFKYLAKHMNQYPAIYIRQENATFFETEAGDYTAWDVLRGDPLVEIPYWHMLSEIQIGCLPELLESAK